MKSFVCALFLVGALLLGLTASAVPSGRPDASLLVNYYLNSTDNTIVTMGGNSSAVVASYPNLKLVVMVYVDLSGMARVGWDTVYVELEPTYLQQNPNEAYYYAGYVEALETHFRMRQMFNNLYPVNTSSALDQQVSPLMKAWIMHQLNWVSETARDRSNMTGLVGDYWKGVRKMMHQVSGLTDGYQAMNPLGSAGYLSDFEIYMLSFYFEIDDVLFWEQNTFPNTTSTSVFMEDIELPPTPPIAPATSRNAFITPSEAASKFRHTHCSALIKVTDNDLFMAHDMWMGYNMMLRQYKTYAFETTVVLSGYPGIVHSGDDWYMLDTGLTVQETTLQYFRKDLASGIKNESVPEFVRVMVANRIATNGMDWTDAFCMQNSGTYNNQYMVVDMKLFNPNGTTAEQKLPTGTLWIAEQIPGFCKTEDATTVLRADSYWASYNLPAIPLIQMESGCLEYESLYGDFFSHEETARAKIFRRNQTSLRTRADVMALMRYNDYLHDPLSRIQNCSTCPNSTCVPEYSPCLAIACRGDLGVPNPTAATQGPSFQFFGQGAFGAIDAKLVSWSEHAQLIGHLISGPTVQPESGISPFDWATSPFASMQPQGVPTTFNFQSVSSTQLLEAPPATAIPYNRNADVEASKLWIIGVVAALVILFLFGVLMYKRRESKLVDNEESTPLAERKGTVYSP